MASSCAPTLSAFSTVTVSGRASISACTFCTAAFFSSSAPVSCVPASLSLTLSTVGFTVSGTSPAMGSPVPGASTVVLLSDGVSSPGAAAASASFCSAAGTATCCSSGSAAGAASCCFSCSVTASASCANAVMGSVEKQRINASNMLNTRFFIPFYLFPLGIVIPIILKITYHTFSQRNHGLHESTQICHESTEEDFKWLNAVQ